MLHKLNRLAGNILLFFCSLILLFLVCEFAMRYVFTDWKDDWDTTQAFRYEDNPGLFEFRIGLERYLDRRPQTFRIIVLGDSYTRGDGIASPKDVYTSVLEKRLKEVYKDINIEVINLGVSGFSTLNEFELLTKLYARLNPDMVIIQFLHNDAQISGPQYAHLGIDDEFGIHSHMISNEHISGWLKRHSYLYNFLEYKYLWLQIKMKLPPNYYVRDDYDGWMQCKYALSSISDLCVKTGIDKPLLVIFPGFIKGVWRESNFPERETHSKVAEYARGCGMYVLDLLPVYLSYNRNLREFWALPLDFHPNKEAHAIAAEEIARFIISNNLIGKRFQIARDRASKIAKNQ